MGRCTYCGRRAGFLRKMHSQCKVQHDTALARIPEFFPRFFDSDLSPDRFCQLLQEGANASYIRLPELRDVVAGSISAAIDRTLQERLLNEAEAKRFADVAEALAPILGSSDRFDEKLAKIEVLTELNSGKIPDVVSIEDELPIELQPDEQVIWIFNGVTAYRTRRAGVSPENSGLQLAVNGGAYYGPLAFDNTNMINLPVQEFVELGRGDLIATSQNLIFLETGGDPRIIPLSKVATVHAYTGAVRLTMGVQESNRAFMLDDVWFAANLIVRLLRLAKQALVPTTDEP
jgi:hypothetical protein